MRAFLRIIPILSLFLAIPLRDELAKYLPGWAASMVAVLFTGLSMLLGVYIADRLWRR